MSAFDGFSIEEKVRFEVLPIFDREIYFRVEFTPREFQTLMRSLDIIDKESERAKKTGSDGAQSAYERAVGEVLSILVRGEEDREYVLSTVVNVDPETSKFMSLGEFMKIIKLCLKADGERLADETKKAEDGESTS